MKKFILIFAALFGLLASALPLQAQDAIDEDGYYYIYNTSNENIEECGMTVQTGRFCWDPLERGNPAFMFRLESTGTENQYYIYNLKEDSWFYAITDYYFSEFKQGEENRAAMLFEPANDDKTEFKVRPVTPRPDLATKGTYDTDGNFWCYNSQVTVRRANNAISYHPMAQDDKGLDNIFVVEKVSDKDLKSAQMQVALRKANDIFNDNSTFTLNESPLITNVPEDCDAQTGEPGQFFSTCQTQTDSRSTFSKLIDGFIGDGRTDNFFQSTDDAALATKPQYIQVDVSADNTEKAVSGIQLFIGIRGNMWGSCQFPTDVTIYVTNDESVAEDMDITTIEQVAAIDSWKKVGDFNLPTDKVMTTANGQWGYTRSANEITNVANRTETKNIIFPDKEKYRFIRIYVNNTAVNCSANHEFTISELQMYELENPSAASYKAEAVEALRSLILSGYEKMASQTVTAEDLTAIEAAMNAVTELKNQALINLQAVVDSVNALNETFTAGTEAGYYDSTAVATYTAALAAATAGTHESHTDAEFDQLGANLLSALNAVRQAIIPVSDGYYNIVNCFQSFWTNMAITGLPTQNILGWQRYDVNNPAQLFKVTKLTDGGYSIQNVQTGKYIGTIAGTSAEVKVTDTQETAQTFTAINNAPGQFNIANVDNEVAYHAEFHQNGANAKGYICTYNGGGGSCSAWRLVSVTGSKLDSLIAVAPKENLKAVAAHAIDSARTAYDKTFNYAQSDHLITQADQWYTTCMEPDANYSSYANLIDGNLGTCYQGTWKVDVHEKPQWIQADLQDNPVQDFTIYYGLRNTTWGAWEQWTQIAVFATNDESVANNADVDTYEQILSADGWKNVGIFDLPDEQAIRNYGGNDRTFTYDINNIMDQKYRFLRFYATHTYKPYPLSYDLGAFTIGELNIMENTYSEAAAPYFYVDGLKAAADELKAQEKLVAASIADGTITQEQIDKLNSLRKTVVSMTSNTDELKALYNTVKAYVEKFGSGDAYGQVDQNEWTNVQTAMSNAVNVIDAEQPTRNEIIQVTDELNEAFDNFKAAQKQFEPNKWYYIVSTDLTRTGSTENNGEQYTGNKYATFCYGNCAYAPADNTYDAVGNWGDNDKNAVKWGYYDAGTGTAGSHGVALYPENLDPHTMWRFVPIEGKDGQYGIQNRANGLFLKSYTGRTWIGLTTDTCAYEFKLLGPGQYKFHSIGENEHWLQFVGDGYLYSYGTSDALNTQWTFNFEPVETEDNIVMEYQNNNSIFIKSLPYAIETAVIEANNGFVDLYGIKGLEVVGSDSTLLLEKKTSIEAGEPFIAIAGDYTAFDADNATTIPLTLPAVDDFNFEGKTVNGLTATLDYTRAPKAGLGYFADAVLKATAANTGIEGHTGYFDVKAMPLFTTTTEANQRIPLNGAGVDAIKSITTGKDGVVNVYSIDGKLIKKNVNRSKAVKDLKKGLYIVGKKKMSVNH